jgi:hypothetical protein
MGEAKRRATLDGGAPSDDRIVLMLDVFNPLEAMLAMNDQARLAAVSECKQRAHQRPTPICAACDYEFDYGQPPALLFITNPMLPKGKSCTGISGMICRRCAALPHDELMSAVLGYLRAAKPDIEIVPVGHA